jgi:hypothetical protein
MVRIFNQFVSAKTFVLIQGEALLIPFSFLSAAKSWFWTDPVSVKAGCDPLYLQKMFLAFDCAIVLNILRTVSLGEETR